MLITGMPAAGKSIISSYLVEEGCPVLSMGDVIREETEKRGLESTPKNVGETAVQIRLEEGEDAVAARCVERLESLSTENPVLCIEGIRSPREVEVFKQTYSNTIIVAIHASPRTRFERFMRRKRSDDPRNLAEFEERDNREIAFGIGSVIALADHLIVNESSVRKARSDVARELGGYLGHGRSSPKD